MTSIYTGRSYSLGKTYRSTAVVRVTRDPVTGRTVISNQGRSASGRTAGGSTFGGAKLGGGFGK